MGRYGARWLWSTGSAPDERWRAYAEKFGPPLTALGWLPFAGDGLILAAGLLKLNVLACTLWQTLGRGLRYAAVLGLLRIFAS
jgi:membrane protein YqaA with SNARE-associated domain